MIKEKEKKLQKIREEVFKTIRVIYIELLVSRPPPIFQENSESSRKERNIEREFF
jgi:hypothetical protein